MRYTWRRWLLKAASWSAGLGLLALVAVEAWRLGLGGGLDVEGLTPLTAFCVGAAFGFGPATLDELVQSRYARNQEHVHGRRARLRPVLIAAGLVTLVLLALVAPRGISAALGETGVQATLQTGRSWTEQRLEDLGNAMDRLIDQATVRYYERPAGTVGGTPAPEGPGIKLPKVLGGG